MEYDELVKLIKEKAECDYCDTLIKDKECGEKSCTELRVKVASIAYEAGKNDRPQTTHSLENSIEYQLGYEAAASDPKAWYVLDKNGEQVHIGDKVKSNLDNYSAEVTGLFPEGVFVLNCGYLTTENIEKVIPDTKEKIIRELTDLIHHGTGEEAYSEEYVKCCEELAERLYDRIASFVKAECDAE